MLTQAHMIELMAARRLMLRSGKYLPRSAVKFRRSSLSAISHGEAFNMAPWLSSPFKSRLETPL